MRRKSEGSISLIELVIGCLIVVVLVAIVLPAFDSHVKRSQTAEVIAATSACQSAVSQYFAGSGPVVTAAALRTVPPRCRIVPSKYVSGGLVAKSGEILVRSAVPGAEGYIALTPLRADGTSARISDIPTAIRGWRCGPSDPSWGPVDPRFLPGTCRG